MSFKRVLQRYDKYMWPGLQGIKIYQSLYTKIVIAGLCGSIVTTCVQILRLKKPGLIFLYFFPHIL